MERNLTKVKFYILWILILVSIFTMNTTVYADSTKNSVATSDEFFTALSKQMLNHKSQEFYYISTDELKRQITQDKDIQFPFLYHYNPKEPLASGCYAYLAINGFRMSWFESRSRTLNVKMNFYVPKDTMQEYFDEMQKLANELKKDTDYESVKAVHDYIIRRVEYDYNSVGQNYTDIEGFRENRMVCQGYSMASFVLLSDMGIPARIVLGKSGDKDNPQSHAWNVVKVDGKWYNYDATWDDAGGEKVDYTYFLKGKNDFPYHYPEGEYNTPEFLNMLSEDSYRTAEVSSNYKYACTLIIILVFAGIILYKKRKYERHNTVVGTVIEDEISFADSFGSTFDNTFKDN